MGVTSYCSPLLHVFGHLLSHEKARVIFNNLLSPKQQDLTLAVDELQVNLFLM